MTVLEPVRLAAERQAPIRRPLDCRPDVSAPIIVDAATSACWTADCPGESVRHPAALAVVKASRCEATNSRTVIGGLPVSSAMNLSSPEKRPF